MRANFMQIIETLFEFNYSFDLKVQIVLIPGHKLWNVDHSVSNLQEVEQLCNANQLLEQVEIKNSDSGDNCLFLALKRPIREVLELLIDVMKRQ